MQSEKPSVSSLSETQFNDSLTASRDQTPPPITGLQTGTYQREDIGHRFSDISLDNAFSEKGAYAMASAKPKDTVSSPGKYQPSPPRSWWQRLTRQGDGTNSENGDGP
ncbi:hypothetical protein H4R34_005775, partial [Dimargaris verticillata]